MTFDPTVFWPAFKAVGMLKVATVVIMYEELTFDVGFQKPGQIMPSGAISAQYEIEYQAVDCPFLAEGDTIAIEGEGDFLVRQPPDVLDTALEGKRPSGADGTWKRVLLTKV